MKGLSLFAGGGIGELGLLSTKIEMVLANELIDKRADLHRFWHPQTRMIVGSISDQEIKKDIIKTSKELDVDFVLCTPPCQGVSLIGKNKNQDDYVKDSRNYLLFDALEVITAISPSIILIENVPQYLNLYLPHKNQLINILEIIKSFFSDKYIVEHKIYNALDFGLAQSRLRAFIKIYKKEIRWNEPELNKKHLTLRDAIGHLPTVESGEHSGMKNHYARTHTDNHILWMKNTRTGESALNNENHYPVNSKTGKRIRAYSSTYRRMDWDKPSPTITMRNDAISSQSNVHPGRLLSDGTYSDARVLTLRELFILFGINEEIDLPVDVSDIQIRHMIGESVPPVMIRKIVEGITLDESN